MRKGLNAKKTAIAQEMADMGKSLEEVSELFQIWPDCLEKIVDFPDAATASQTRADLAMDEANRKETTARAAAEEAKRTAKVAKEAKDVAVGLMKEAEKAVKAAKEMQEGINKADAEKADAEKADKPTKTK